MLTPLLVLFAIVFAFLCGRGSWRLQGAIRSAYYRHKHGICNNYMPTGRRENRKGTISDFCVRCGHPAGAH